MICGEPLLAGVTEVVETVIQIKVVQISVMVSFGVSSTMVRYGRPSGGGPS